jgi:hypothetical protein
MEERQLHVARALAGLLSPEPGSVIFGTHVGGPDKGFIESPMPGHRMFSHSPASWMELWDGLIFEKGVVNVSAKLVQMARPDAPNITFRLLVWSVKRL